MPVFVKYGIHGERLSMGARTLPPDPVVQTKVRQLFTKYLGKPDDDFGFRPTHGLRKDAVGNEPTDALKFAMKELSDFSILLSDDGANRKGATPDWWKAMLDYVFEHPKMQNPLVSKTSATGEQRCKVSFEKFMTDETDIPNVKEIIKGCEQRGFTFVNKGKYPYVIECKVGEVKKQTCWDGSEIITDTCKAGRWVPTQNKCPVPECKTGETKSITCWDGSEIITDTCQGGKWVPTQNKCPEQPTDCHCRYYLNVGDKFFGIDKFIKCLLKKIPPYCKK